MEIVVIMSSLQNSIGESLNDSVATVSGTTGTSVFETGVWNDEGIWDDTDIWQD